MDLWYPVPYWPSVEGHDASNVYFVMVCYLVNCPMGTNKMFDMK